MSAFRTVKQFLAPWKHTAPSRAARFVYRYLFDPAARSVARLSLSKPRNLFQPYNDTKPDRYPALFRATDEIIGDGSGRRLLSFGCSTGEEVQGLRARHPHAFIKGIDINPHNIAVCRRKLRDVPQSALAFEIAGTTDSEASASYDAIFCLAVLRHGDLRAENVMRCDHLVRFADFERQVADFARCLKVGGLLALRFSNFRFVDTAVAAQFEIVLSLDRPAGMPQFGPDNCRLPPLPLEDSLFRKLRDNT